MKARHVFMLSWKRDYDWLCEIEIRGVTRSLIKPEYEAHKMFLKSYHFFQIFQTLYIYLIHLFEKLSIQNG